MPFLVLAYGTMTIGVELWLELDSRIGTGRVTGMEDYPVKTSTSSKLQGFRYYPGARLVNAQRNTEYRITEVTTRREAFIDKQVHPDAKADKLAKEFASEFWFEVHA